MLGLTLSLWNQTAATSGGGGAAFTPASLSPNVWIEADPTKLYTDAGTTLVSADGDAVQQANDKSGNGRNVTQATSTARPLYKTGSGKPYLQYDGVDDVLLTASGQTLKDGSGQFWVAASGYFNDTSIRRQLAGQSGSTGWSLNASAAADAEARAANTTPSLVSDVASGTITAATPAVLIMQVTTTSVEVWLNNVSDGGTAFSNPNLSTGAMQIGGSSLAGRIYGVVQGSGVISSTDRGNLQTYLAGLHP